MDFETYQQRATGTEQAAKDGPADETSEARARSELIVRLLGLAGEAGSAATVYKKHLRDGEAYEGWRSHMREELGDVLWYIASIASRLDLQLDDIAQANLAKTTSRWSPGENDQLDAGAPEDQQLPRVGAMEFRETVVDGKPTLRLYMDGQQIGDPLTDNSRNPDGYRFHDIFHLAYAVTLGWSPVMRQLLKRKRKYDEAIDDAEDGGRAIVTEEGLAGLAFAYATRHNGLDGITHIDNAFLDMISLMTGHLEVGVRSAADWEVAILEGHRLFRLLVEHGGGTVTFDADHKKLDFTAPQSA